MFERELRALDDKLKDIRTRMGGSRRLNNLVGYVRELEEKERERKLKRLQGVEGDEAVVEVVDDYRYPPAQLVDGKSVFSVRPHVSLTLV